MRIIGFSGSRDLTPDEEVHVERILYTLNGDGIVTGACLGIDEFVATWFLSHRPYVKQILLVPADRSRVNMRFVDTMLLQKNVEVQFMPPGSSYAMRNIEIVNNSTNLVGFPKYHESHPQSRRSGTWQTIRKAKLAGKVTSVHVLTDRLIDG